MHYEQLVDFQAEMREQGKRYLLLLSGDREWCQTTITAIRADFSGDWLWLGSPAPVDFRTISSANVTNLLGSEFRHAVIDAHDQLDVDGLAVFAGCLSAGSWLVMLVPGWENWPHCIDQDSLRWTQASVPIATPHFIRHLQNTLQKESGAIIWRQGQLCSLPSLLNNKKLSTTNNWLRPTGMPTAEQETLLEQLLQAQRAVWVLMADRGRGKSALAGMLVSRWQGAGQCWLTAPNQAASLTLQQYAQGRARFWAPDELLAYCRQHRVEGVDWLLIDEAAAIPLPLLNELLSFFPRILLTTTVNGYEGTGRGFFIKFCAGLPEIIRLQLTEPIRWAKDDPLESLINQALLFTDVDQPQFEQSQLVASEWRFEHLDQQQLTNRPDWLQQFYLLLVSAHYRTRPLDLRRLMDASGMSYGLAINSQQRLIGGLWRVAEGGLAPDLACAIWAGHRRPKGNLVAQSLAAHGGQWQAPILRSSRISRIAVAAGYRRQGIARSLLMIELANARQQAEDYVSVSFGLTAELWQFWQAMGFELVRIGNQQEAFSGCYTAMAIYPLTESGQALCHEAKHRLARASYWLPAGICELLEWPIVIPDLRLEQNDWRELVGFAFALRPIEASQAALYRLLANSSLPLSALRSYLELNLNVGQTVRHCGLRGKKALMLRWRQETAQALEDLDPQACAALRSWLGEFCPTVVIRPSATR